MPIGGRASADGRSLGFESKEVSTAKPCSTSRKVAKPPSLDGHFQYSLFMTGRTIAKSLKSSISKIARNNENHRPCKNFFSALLYGFRDSLIRL